VTDSKTVVEDRVSPKLNEENMRKLAEALAAVGPFARQRGAELGVQIAAGLRQMVKHRG